MKVCNMNCAYCAYGWTRGERRTPDRAAGWPTPAQIEAALASRLKRAADDDELIDHITVAGHGEPTLHPEFEEIVDRLRACATAWRPASDRDPVQFDDRRLARRAARARRTSTSGT